MAYRTRLDDLLEQNIRSDGRDPDEPRNILCELGIFHPNANGSASFSIGNTKVFAAVYGPHEVRQSKSKGSSDKLIINCEYSAACFSSNERKTSTKTDRKSMEISANLKGIMESVVIEDLFAGSQIDVYIELIQDDGGSYSACINATTLALVDAGIPMRDYVVACTGTMTHGVPMVDINSQERGSGCAEVTVAVLGQTSEIIALDLTQVLQHSYIEDTIKEAIKGCMLVHKVLEEAVRHKFIKLEKSLTV